MEDGVAAGGVSGSVDGPNDAVACAVCGDAGRSAGEGISGGRTRCPRRSKNAVRDGKRLDVVAEAAEIKVAIPIGGTCPRAIDGANFLQGVVGGAVGVWRRALKSEVKNVTAVS